MPWIQLREVECTSDAQAEVDQACEQFPRFAEMWEGLLWLLRRQPEPVGSFRTTYSGRPFVVYCVEGDSVAGTPSVNLVYEFDDGVIKIHGVNAISIEPDQEG